MNEWGVFLVIVEVVGFLIMILTFILTRSDKRSDKDTDIAVVIQQNTDAINGLTKELRELSVDNKRDHDHFFSDINQLKLDVSNIKLKHDADIKLLEEHTK